MSVAPGPLARWVILLIGEVSETLETLTACLEKAGAVVMRADSGAHAVQLAGTVMIPDAVVIDILLGGRRWWLLEIAKGLGRRYRCPVVALSGSWPDAPELSEFERVVRKPFDPPALVSTLDELLRTQSGLHSAV